MKVVMELGRDKLKNSFLSLALPSLVFSEPAAPTVTVINEQLSFTLWDKWEVRGNKVFKLQDFLKAIKVYTYTTSSLVMYVSCDRLHGLAGFRGHSLLCV